MLPAESELELSKLQSSCFLLIHMTPQEALKKCKTIVEETYYFNVSYLPVHAAQYTVLAMSRQMNSCVTPS